MTTEKSVKVRIVSKTHEHAGTPVEPGTVLEVDSATATHFVKLGAAELVGGPVSTVSPVATSAPRSAGGE